MRRDCTRLNSCWGSETTSTPAWSWQPTPKDKDHEFTWYYAPLQLRLRVQKLTIDKKCLPTFELQKTAQTPVRKYFLVWETFSFGFLGSWNIFRTTALLQLAVKKSNRIKSKKKGRKKGKEEKGRKRFVLIMDIAEWACTTDFKRLRRVEVGSKSRWSWFGSRGLYAWVWLQMTSR